MERALDNLIKCSSKLSDVQVTLSVNLRKDERRWKVRFPTEIGGQFEFGTSDRKRFETIKDEPPGRFFTPFPFQACETIKWISKLRLGELDKQLFFFFKIFKVEEICLAQCSWIEVQFFRHFFQSYILGLRYDKLQRISDYTCIISSTFMFQGVWSILLHRAWMNGGRHSVPFTTELSAL